ncbi:polymerase delta-interacting protein 3-like [Actinia tenebrosa]|uniref:Polymerase delta-interacting protein 3-like n=1 Tax=Actinia tenebrosa TaxID=6105 RepID=A0A6P8ISM3_ACTTE|nr:polymerase delta-interacting protein 3-like [Actinia tenebrosa]
MNNRKGKIRNFNSNRLNRSVGMTTEELRSRKTAREGFKRPVKDLRLNLKKTGSNKPGPSRVMDARSKLQAKRSVEELVEKSSFNIDERKKQQKSSNQVGNRSLSLDSGTIKITAKQSLPPNRSAELAGKSIVITTKVDPKDKSKSKQRGKPKDRNLKLGVGGITVTTKAAGGSPHKKKRQYAELSRDEERRKDEDLDYYHYKKLKEESRFEEDYLPLRNQRNMTPLAERLDHGPIPEPLGTPVTSTKVTITNLHPAVSRQDIEELFGAVGVLKSCKMLGPGAAEVIYTVKEDAVTAYARYHNRNLDGQPMQCKLSVVQTMATYTAPLSRPLVPLRSTNPSQRLLQPTVEPYQPPKRASSSLPSESRPVVFKVKI